MGVASTHTHTQMTETVTYISKLPQTLLKKRMKYKAQKMYRCTSERARRRERERKKERKAFAPCPPSSQTPYIQTSSRGHEIQGFHVEEHRPIRFPKVAFSPCPACPGSLIAQYDGLLSSLITFDDFKLMIGH